MIQSELNHRRPFIVAGMNNRLCQPLFHLHFIIPFFTCHSDILELIIYKLWGREQICIQRIEKNQLFLLRILHRLSGTSGSIFIGSCRESYISAPTAIHRNADNQRLDSHFPAYAQKQRQNKCQNNHYRRWYTIPLQGTGFPLTAL